MNRVIAILIFVSFFSTQVKAQRLKSDNKALTEAFNLAINTVDINVRRGVLAAGGDYGGEWTRDIAINSWNGVSLLRPQVAENSLWSVTVKKDSVGHQYWDKIIWVVAALNHYKVTGDEAFLADAYTCSANTMRALEQSTFDKNYGLFMGPSVFNDGIAGYPETIYDSLNNSSFVLDHPKSKNIKCLSTNSIYYGAYLALAEMSAIKKDGKADGYLKGAANLKSSILKYLYNEKENKLFYLIDNNGKADSSQEGLGVSFAILFGVVNKKQAEGIVANIKSSSYGLPSIYPHFARYNAKNPGRHNYIVWPMVNGFFAEAALKANNYKVFTTELNNLTRLALDEDKGDYNFREIYNASTGIPDGGWQRRNTKNEFHWDSYKNQTWSATAYLRMILDGVFGLEFDEKGITIHPFLPEDIKSLMLTDLPYRNATLNIELKGSGKSITSFVLNGKKQNDFKIPSTAKGVQEIVITLK